MEDRKKIFLFITSEKHPSPFDLFVMYDAGADAVLSYGDVLPEEVERLIIDAMFSRGPKGIKNTAIFVGGRSVKEGKVLLEEVSKTLFPPFEISVAFDPRGASTTSASIVALAKRFFMQKLGEGLDGKIASVLAGGGNVGSMTVYLLVCEGVKVRVLDIDFDKAKEAISLLDHGFLEDRVQILRMDALEQACKESDLIISAGPPGVRIVGKEIIRELTRCKLLMDTNPIPPHGIDGVTPEHNFSEVVPGVYGVGSKAIGALKLRTERAFLKKVLEAPKGVFGPREALEVAYSLVSL